MYLCSLVVRLGGGGLRRCFFLLVLGVWGWAQSSEPGVLERCQGVFQALHLQFAYAERVAPQRFLLRVVLGAGEASLTRLTVNIDLRPVPLGLEDIAVVVLERPVQDAVRLRNRLAQSLEGVPQSLSLGNWYVAAPTGYRCFLTHQGRVVGVLLLGPNLEPIPNPRWRAVYQRSPVRFPPELR